MNLIFLAFFLAIALFQAIVVGQDDPSNTVQVTVTQFSYTGNGCPPRGNNATASLVMAGATMTSIFDNFTAYAGPNVKTDQNLKTCNTTLHLQVPNGLRFTMAKIDVRGYTNMTKEFVAFYRIAYSLGSPNNMYNSPVSTLATLYFVCKLIPLNLDQNAWCKGACIKWRASVAPYMGSSNDFTMRGKDYTQLL